MWRTNCRVAPTLLLRSVRSSVRLTMQHSESNRRLTVGIVAGEASGDLLGSRLMAALRNLVPDVRYLGVGGNSMIEAGLEPVAPYRFMSVNGFVDPIKKLPRLLRVKKILYNEFLSVDIVIGVDFNVFNLLLERALKKRGIPTVHYVSPSVYAWRQRRAKRVGKSADIVLTLFPFEPPFYERYNVAAEFVGHPLADEIEPVDSINDANRRSTSRQELGIDENRYVIAALPGSRTTEIKMLARLFIEACKEAVSTALVVIPCVNSRARAELERLFEDMPDPPEIMIVGNVSRKVISAADVTIVKAGTSTLEAMLLGRPMVVAYKLGALTHLIVRRLIKIPYVALPNILGGRKLVPEFLQKDATVANLSRALVDLAENDREEMKEFDSIHRHLRRDASKRAAEAVLRLYRSKYGDWS